MLPYCRSLTPLVLASCALVSIAGCANSPLGEALKNSFAADPRLTETAARSSPTPVVSQTGQTAQLPDDFPDAIPRYPGAELQQVASGAGSAVETRWVSEDGSDRILSFYRKALQTNNWQILNSTSGEGNEIAAKQDGLNVTVNVQPTAGSRPDQKTAAEKSPAQTELVIQYTRNSSEQTSTPLPPADGLAKLAPFSGSVDLGAAGDSTGALMVAAELPFTDLNKTPKELRQNVEDVARLGILTPAPLRQKQKQAKTSDLFAPNQTVTRREFARWLVAANNRLYRDRPAQQIRLGVTTAQPAFRDVARSDPDFPAIQGLAEAGIIPSSLAGDPTAVTFRPNAPLTRETLLLWKVPLDNRQALPTATVEGVKQTWGFQDANKINPRSLKAVLADYQNGDLSNIRRIFGYTSLFQPKKPVTRAEAAATLWYFGYQGEGESAQSVLKPAVSETQAE